METMNTPHPLKAILKNRKIRYEDAAKMTGYSKNQFEGFLNGRNKMPPRARLLFEMVMTRLSEKTWTE